MTTKKLLTAHEAAAYLSLSIHTVRLYSRNGRLPRLKIGSKVLFETDTLDRFLAKARVAGIIKRDEQ